MWNTSDAMLAAWTAATRAALATRPAAGEPIRQWADQDLWMDGDEADMASARAEGFKTRTLWTAPPAAAHGDEAVMWVECEPGAAQFKRLPKDWLLLLSTKVHTTNPGDRSPNVVFPLHSAMRAQGDGEVQ